MGKFFDAIARRTDELVGASELKSDTRAQLVVERVQAIYRLVPVLGVASALAALLILWAASDGVAFEPLLFWTACICGLALLAQRGAAQAIRTNGTKSVEPNAIRNIVRFATVAGLAWGIMPVLVLPAGSSHLANFAGVAAIGILCAGSYSLAAHPAIAVFFATPMLVGLLLSMFQVDFTSGSALLSALVLTLVIATQLIGLRTASRFVEHLILESRIREQKDIISLLLREFEENASDWLWEFDREGRIERVSDRFASVAQLSAEQLVGIDFCDLFEKASSENTPIVAAIRRDIQTRSTFRDVVVKVDIGGEENWWRLTGKPIHDSGGQFAGYVGTASIITAERVAERRINFLAHHDPLTGLLNRSMFTEHLRQCVARLERYGTPFTVLYLDLDQFKAVNDSRGHMIGDTLLIEVGKRIRGVLREADVVARLGGDEFAIILTQNFTEKDVSGLAGRLVESVCRPYELTDEIVSIGVSIGIAIAPINGTRPDQILRNADLALYRAKAEGRGTFRFFESQMDADARERRMLEHELREALKNDEFVLHFQPLVSVEDNKPGGFEALIRWNHEVRGLVPPAEFIPIAEQTGLIRQIGDWTIQKACKEAAGWPEDLLVAVNISARHFQLSDITAVVRASLEASGLAPHRLELEITESLLIENPDEVVAKLMELKELGVTIAMDDFGTGYSSLSYLLKFPFDKIKIDKSFVKASSEDIVAKDILRSIAALGKTLKIRITAEGVETLEQVNFLRGIACNQLQGFYFAKPLDNTELPLYFLNQFRKSPVSLPEPGKFGLEFNMSAKAGGKIGELKKDKG